MLPSESYSEVFRLLVEILSMVLAVIFGILRKYHANQRKKVEAESSTKDNKIRELEITLLMRKRELEEQREQNVKLESTLETEQESRKKAEHRLQKLREALKKEAEDS